MNQRIEIPLKQLNIWTDNPRIANADVNNEDEAISLIFSTVGESKMINLAKDIAKHNLNPNHLPIVVRMKLQIYMMFMTVIVEYLF